MMKSLSSASLSVSSGSVTPQGAHLVDGGVNFAVYSPSSSQLTLCLFDSEGHEEQLAMYPSMQGIWHIFVDGLTAGQKYGFRADGQWSSTATPRFNKQKLLMDPYAREVVGTVQWSPDVYGDTSTDSAPFMPRNVVRGSGFDWQGTGQPKTPTQNSVIYEAHIKGFSQNNPVIPEPLRGTYLGMSHSSSIAYLKKLGVTAVELLPVTSKVSEERLKKLGLSNYWGYNPLCLMAPELSFAVDDPVRELKTMVRELHRAGIEVILDVVFNHTCESGTDGPVLSMRGLAENDYYHMDTHNGELESVNFSGCGNTMNFDNPQTLRLTMDALRHWAQEYQIDGFRFDLAPVMARQHRHFSPDSPFFFAIRQDPVLNQLKMIAEPWDIGPDGYHLTDFPEGWQAWNDRFRDGCRKFWKGEAGMAVEMAQRFSGSDDLFEEQGSFGTINYICSHDGFTLMDLVSYNERHNHANGEENRDGDSHNCSWNHGVEGHSDHKGVRAARLQSRKNLLAMLMLAKGTPMLMAGDEFGHSQQGNNNAYCQDSEISWLDWSQQDNILGELTSQLIHYRKSQPLLMDDSHDAVYDYFSACGKKLDIHCLASSSSQLLSIRIHSRTKVASSALIVLMNPSPQSVKVTLPSVFNGLRRWFVVLDTSKDDTLKRSPLLLNGWYDVPPNSLVLIEDTQ